MLNNIVRLLAAGALLLALSPAPALAQEQVTVVDSCTAVDHFPASPIGNAPSLAILIFLLSGFNPYVGHTITANVTGASGDVSGSGVLDMYGVVEVPVPLYQYGAHTVTDLMAQNGSLEHIAGEQAGGTFILQFDVNDAEPTCDVDAMRGQGEALLAAASTTTTSTSTTTSSSTTTTSTTTTTTITSSEPQPEASESTNPNVFPLAFALIGPGALLLLIGAWLLMQESTDKVGKDCSKLLELWQSAEARVKKGEKGLSEARATLTSAKQRVSELEAELASLEKAAGSYVTEHGTNYHLIPGGRVTSDGLADITASVKRNLESARARVKSEEKNVSQWEQRVNELRAGADKAKAAYEACVGAATAPTDTGTTDPGPTDTTDVPTGGLGVVTVPVGTSVVDEADETDDGCEEGTREERAGTPESPITVDVDFSIIIEPEGIRNVEGAQAMAFGLSNLARDLDLAGSLLGGASAGTSIVGGIGGMQSGSYVAGAGGLISGTVSGVMTGAGAHVGSGDMEISIPTSPPEAMSEVLEATARLGAIVASKVGEWLVMNELYHVRIRFFTQTLTATPYEIWECRGGKMVCSQKTYGIEIGKLKRGGQPNPRTFRLDSDLARRRFEQHINSLTNMAKSRLEAGARKRAEFEQKHQPGPCSS